MYVWISKMVKISWWYSQFHLGWHFRKLQAQSSKVFFATFQWKETFELWALSFKTGFENVTPSGIGCTLMIDNGSKNVSRSHLWRHFPMLFGAQCSKLELLFWLKHGKRDVRGLSFVLSKMTPEVGLTVLLLLSVSWTVFQFHGLYFVNSKIYCVLKCLCVVKLWRKRWMLDDVCKSVVFSVDILWVIARARLLPHALCPSFQADWQ